MGYAPPPTYQYNAHQSMNYEDYSTMSDNPSSIAMSEMTELITSLLDPDILLTKSDEATWTPPVRPMHRIFDMAGPRTFEEVSAVLGLSVSGMMVRESSL